MDFDRDRFASDLEDLEQRLRWLERAVAKIDDEYARFGNEWKHFAELVAVTDTAFWQADADLEALLRRIPEDDLRARKPAREYVRAFALAVLLADLKRRFLADVSAYRDDLHALRNGATVPERRVREAAERVLGYRSLFPVESWLDLEEDLDARELPSAIFETLQAQDFDGAPVDSSETAQRIRSRVRARLREGRRRRNIQRVSPLELVDRDTAEALLCSAEQELEEQDRLDRVRELCSDRERDVLEAMLEDLVAGGEGAAPAVGERLGLAAPTVRVLLHRIRRRV